MARQVTVKQFLAGHRARMTRLCAANEARIAGFNPDPAASWCRRDAAQKSLRFFTETYFPAYVSHAPSTMHEWLFETLPAFADDQKGRRLAIAAPRGEAKTTIVARIFVLWCVVTGRQRYIPIILATYRRAVLLLEEIAAQLLSNPRLGMDYPEWCGVREGEWQADRIVTNGPLGCCIQAFGAGQTGIRGISYGPYRPGLVVMDDLENDRNVASPEQRDKLESWVDRTVLALGPPDGTLKAIWIGTILHYDSALARKLRHVQWEGEKFQAIIEWPKRMDLWDAWEQVYTTEGEAAADAYYGTRAREMEDGSVVSWPAYRPLLSLMKRRAGAHPAFDSEYQNDPVSLGDAPLAGIQTWDGHAGEGWLWYGACDPSLGKSSTGDPSAILVGGWDRKAATLYVAEAYIARRKTSDQIALIIELQRRYQIRMWAFESVQFQDDMRDHLLEKSAQAGVPVPARAVIPRADKDVRIELLEPYISQGRIKVRPSHHTLIQQLRHYPKADRKDGPDALHMLFMAATSGSAPMDYTPANPHGSPWRMRTDLDDGDREGTFADHDNGRFGPGGF